MDLFAGCGGLTRGLLDTRKLRGVFAVEMDEDAAATYRENFGDHVFCGPIERVESFPARALEEAEPDVFVMENVPQLLRSAEYAAFKRAARALGFDVVGRVLNAADFGVPQTRKRAIVIGSRLGVPPLPRQTHFRPDVAPRARRHWRTVEDAIW
jgi:DNA (cytosine-5)-methyltransferase 1